MPNPQPPAPNTSISIRLFPCLDDNYGFLVHDVATGQTAAVDTPDAGPILAEAAAAGWTISQVWNTHHHHDHIGGNGEVRERTGARLTAPINNRSQIPGADVYVDNGDAFTLGQTPIRVMATPGHTLGHVAYHLPNDGVIFVGDTLFPLGCGRLFEGSPAQMWASLSTIAALPGDTIVYAAHEYTQANAAFCLAMEPENQALVTRAEAVDQAHASGTPTVPTTIADELATNVFLRPQSADIRRRLGMADASDGDVFAELRRRKDAF